MPEIKSIILNTPAEALESILSPFIEEQFPSFMRSDYRKLVLFIKAYYEWAETQGNSGFVNSNIDSAIDIDNNLDQFYSHFKTTFLDSFPEIFATNVDGLKPNKKTLLKKIKQFYGSKGTESAYRFLFRLLFDSAVQFYYPKNDILRASDGKWVEQISIKITRNNETIHKYAEGGKVQQYKDLYTLQAYATIDRVFQYYQDGVPITELYLTDLVGNFLPNAEVVLTPPDSAFDPFTETTFSVLGDFYIQTAGSNYNVGDVVYLQGDGVGFSAKVQQTGLDGSVKRIQIENSGINYVNTVSALVISSNGVNTNAQIVFTPSAVTRYPGYYKGNTGKISSTPKIYDGDYYQEFSYELKSAVSIDRFYSVLKELVHPAGMKMFGSILLEGDILCEHIGSSQLTRVGIPVLGNYLPYTFGTTLDLRNNGVTAAGNWVFQEYGITYGTTGDLYPAGYNPYIGSTAELGPNGLTAPLGTTFTAGGSGGNLGYTYCFVPEGGTVAHRPLGAPLGGITAWLLGNESRLGPDVVGNSPFGLVGLTLWLKPENIGVCGGSLITGRSMDIWRDASLSQNHAVPPKWDLWDNQTVVYIRKNIGGGSNWNQSVWNTNPCDNLEFIVGNYGPPIKGISEGNGNGFMLGFWGAGGTGPLGTGGNSINLGYHRLDFSFYIINPNSRGGTPYVAFYEVGRTGGGNGELIGTAVARNNYTSQTIFGLSHDKVNDRVTYYLKENPQSAPTILRGPIGVSAGEVFYPDSSWIYPASNCQIVKCENAGVELPASGWTATTGMRFSLVRGVTVDKLRPTLVVNDRGIAGRTGIQFNGGVVYGPQTVWTQAGLCGGYYGDTLGSNGVAPFVSGYTGEAIQSGRFFTLTRGLSLTKDMTVFVVFRAGTTASGYTASNFGLGLASSSKRFANFTPAVENTRTNLLSNTSDLSDKTNWPDFLSGSGVATTRTYGNIWAPDGTTTATRIALNKGAGTASTDWCLVLQSLSWSVGAKFGGFIWMRSTSGTATVILRHASGNVYQTLNLTTTWQKFYIPQTASIATGNFQFGLRGTYGTPDTATVDVWQPQLFSGWGLTPFTSETDHLLYHRSYSDIDADTTKQNSTYYFVNSGTNESFYPYESGLVGLRSNTGSTTASRIAFNPYRSTTTGVSLENISLGEWRRNPDGRIQSFYNGEESTNYSVDTARRIARPDSPGGSNPSNFAASEVSYNGATLDIGQFGAFCLPVLDSPYSNTSANFVTAALANIPYSFNGVIYEILVYDRVLDQSERLLVYAYLSRKYRLEASLGQFFEGAGFGCYPAAVAAGYPYWYIAKHPNTAGSKAVPLGMSMGNMTIQSLLSLYGLLYKSAGTRLADGTVLTEDTYDTLGE